MALGSSLVEGAQDDESDPHADGKIQASTSTRRLHVLMIPTSAPTSWTSQKVDEPWAGRIS